MDSAGSCLSLNASSTLMLNSTLSTHDTYISAECTAGYQLSVLGHAGVTQFVFHCVDSLWQPSIPKCFQLKDSGVPVGVVVGCTIGGVVCLLVVLLAVYLLYRTRDEGKLDLQNQQLHQSKMMHMNFFMTSCDQDNVGMPAVTCERLDLDLPHVTSEQVTSYGSIDTRKEKLYRSSGSIFDTSEHNTGSDVETSTPHWINC